VFKVILLSVVAEIFDVSKSTAYSTILRTCKLFYRFRNDFIFWPSRHELSEIEREFGLRSPYPGIIGAIDGTHVKISGQVDNSYIDRNHNYSLHIQLICDAKRVFTDVFCGFPGSVHDQRVFRNSPVYQFLVSENSNLSQEQHLIGDSAYKLEKFIMTPFRHNNRLNASEREYNFRHSSARMVIENAIGQLKGKWRRLKFLEIQNIDNAKLFIIAACCLHNFLIRNNVLNIDDEAEQNFDAPNEDNFPEEANLNRTAIQKRDQIKEIIRQGQ
jgi:hypothetical protein